MGRSRGLRGPRRRERRELYDGTGREIYLYYSDGKGDDGMAGSDVVHFFGFLGTMESAFGFGNGDGVLAGRIGCSWLAAG